MNKNYTEGSIHYFHRDTIRNNTLFWAEEISFHDGYTFPNPKVQSYRVIGHLLTSSSKDEKHQGLKGKWDLINLLMKIRKWIKLQIEKHLRGKEAGTRLWHGCYKVLQLIAVAQWLINMNRRGRRTQLKEIRYEVLISQLFSSVTLYRLHIKISRAIAFPG